MTPGEDRHRGRHEGRQGSAREHRQGGDTAPALRIGIDLGGTKIAAIALDAADRVVFEHRVATPRNDYEATIRAVRDLVMTAEAAAGQVGSVGIGLPGSLSPADGRVQNANSVWLNNRPFGEDLRAALARPLRLANDADCLALSEAHDGAGAGAGSVFAVILGTGCGAGIVIGRRLLRGPNAIAGEWGHNPLPWPRPDELPGPTCWCGKAGCMEMWVSGPGLAADHRRTTGQRLDAVEISERAMAGAAEARASLERHLDRLGRGLAMVINILDPEVVVLAGGLSNLPGLAEALPDATRRHVFARSPKVTIVPARHGDASGVRGAARLWP